MKRPQPDLNKTIVDSFIAKTGANRKLSRLWGTTFVNGVEVLHGRRHYHKAAARPDNHEKLFKFLKVWNDVKDYSGDGIKSAWFTLNKSNGPEDRSISKSFITDNLNRMWWDTNDGVMPEGLTLTTTVVISEGFNSTDSVSNIDWSLSKADMAQFVLTNYEELWQDKKIVQEGVGVINKGTVLDTELNVEVADEDDLSPDDPWLSILSRYALRDSGVACTIKDVEVGIGIVNSTVRNTIVITLEIPYMSFSNSNSIISRIADDLSSTNFPVNRRRSGGAFGKLSGRLDGFSSVNEHLTQRAAKSTTYYETVDDVDAETVSRSYLQWENSLVEVSIYDNFWIEDGGTWYLKAEVIDDPKKYDTTHIKLNAYIFSLLDTGYKKKKVPVWKKIVAVIIFIVAVVVAFIDYTGTASNVLFKLAYVILVGAMVVALVTALLSAIGMQEWAMAFAWVSKEIEPLVTVASIIMVVDYLSTAADHIAEQGLKQFAMTMAEDMFVTGLKDIAAGSITTASINVINKAVSVYANVQIGKLEKLSDRNKDLKAEYEKLAEESMMDSDVMKGYMNIYARPATADWSIYASTYDLPYERGGGALSMGNIQRTTKQAIRKADYEEPMFDSINFI